MRGRTATSRSRAIQQHKGTGDGNRFEIITPYGIEEIHRRLVEITTKPRMDALLPFKDRHLKGMYHGTLTATGFKLQRLVVDRTIAPKLTGKYAVTESGTTIIIITNKNELITSVIGVTIGLMLPGVVAILTAAITGDRIIWAIPLILVIVGVMYGYVRSLKSQITGEAEKDRKILSRLLEG